MPALNNELLNSDLLVAEFERDVVGQSSEALKRFCSRLKKVYGEGIEDEGQRSVRFSSNYPRLKAVLDLIFSEEAPDLALTQMKSLEMTDWDLRQAEEQFEALNARYGYFHSTPASLELFKRLAAASRVMIVIFEQNNTTEDVMAYDYAYKLMALFGPVEDFADVDKAFKEVSLAAANLMKSSESRQGKPYHDVLLVNTELPLAFDLTPDHRKGWQSLIKKHGEVVLKPFKSAARIQELFHRVPSSLDEAKAMAKKCTYQRAEEDNEFAETCSFYGVSEATFNTALDYMALGWPKKRDDTLPDVRVLDERTGYVWFKLPVDDKRALILGTITHCCQDIKGHSQQCVKDAVSLRNNGLYVLGRLKPGVHDELEIIGQSYVWRTRSGNVCFDSIECTLDSITDPVLKEMTTQLAHAMMSQDPNIMRVTVGLGGKTPEGLFEPVPISETMREGVSYVDADEQAIIACRKTMDEVYAQALREVLKDKPQDFYDCIEYLAQYAQDDVLFVAQVRELLATTPRLITELTLEGLMRLFVAGHCPSLDDLKPVDLDALEHMTPEERLGLNISTARLIWRADVPEELLAVLPYVYESERLAAVKEKDRFGEIVLQRAARNPQLLRMMLPLLSESERFAVVKEKDSDGRTVLHWAVSNSETLRMILDLYPESERLAAVKEKDGDGHTVLQRAASNSESLGVMLALYPESERLAAVKEKDGYGGTLLLRAVRNPESLRMMLALLSESERLAAVKEKDRNGSTVLHLAASNPESLRMILALYPESERLSAVKEKDRYGQTMLHLAAYNPDLLRMMLALYPESERVAAVKEKDGRGDTVLLRAATNPESLRMMLALYPESERLAAVKEKDSDGRTVLQLAVSNPELFCMMLALLPESERLVAVKEKDSYRRTVLHWPVSNPESLRMMLALYPESERLAAVKEKDGYGGTLLLRATYNSELLRMMLALLPLADVLVLSGDHTDIFSGSNIELLKRVLYEKLNVHGLDEAASSRVKVLLDESRTLNDLIHIMEEMQTLRPQVKSGPGFFQSSGPESDVLGSNTENMKPKG